MGKTFKGKAKAKAKIAKAKAKIARKCKGCACALVAFGLALLIGCATSDSAQPAKSQTQNNTFEDCIIVVGVKCSVSNRIVRADGTKDAPAVELFTQTQSLESTGSTETIAPTSTQTPTTDIRPDIDVRYNDALAAASNASKGVLESLTAAGANKVLAMMADKSTGTVEVTKKDGTTATVECKDGQCSFSDTGDACADGNCTAK